MSAKGWADDQKLNQTAALLSLGWVLGVQLDSLETIIFAKVLSKNYVAKNVGMKSSRFSALGQTLFSSEPSWTPKTQPNDSRAAVWLSFWCSTRPSADTGTD